MSSDLERIGRFAIDGLIGIGGMGSVYRATDVESGETVAVKILPEVFSKRGEFLERFRREARTYMSVSHDSIPRIVDFGEEKGRYYLALEWLEGKEAADWLKENNQPATNAEWKSIVTQICRALGAAHTAGVFHRDLNARNVLLAADGRVAILDFGLARMVQEEHFTMTGQILGTPEFTSPEQIEASKDAGAQSDIWSLGCLGYLLATGELPFHGDSVPNIIRRILDPSFHPPPPRNLNPKLSPRIESIIMKCLERDRIIRYRSVDEIVMDLDGDPSDAVYRRRQNSRPFVIGAMIVAALLIAGGVFAVFGGDSRQKENNDSENNFLAEEVELAVGTVPSDQEALRSDSLININTASKEELMKIYRIGENKSAQIVNFRETAGAFESIDQLKRLPGIGGTVFQSLERILYVGPPSEKLPNRKKINLNTATLDELKSEFPKLTTYQGDNEWRDLEDLVAERDKRGGFASIDEVTELKGFSRNSKRFWLLSKMAVVE